MISPPGLEIYYFALLVILGSFMVNSFLSFRATNEFEIYYGFGPTETRVVFIGINTYQIQTKIWDIDMETKKEEVIK